jgi:site-specific DNA-methyltransferase (adenine-specific)
MQTNSIYNNNINDFFKNVPDKFVDLFIIDPPYMQVVSDRWDNQWRTIEEYQNWCEEWIKSISRTSKNSGSVWIFGYPYQLSKLINIFEKYGFTFKQQVVIWKGMKSAAGRVSDKLKMYPTTTESIFFFHKESRNEIRDMLTNLKIEYDLTPTDINKYLGKAFVGGGTWSSIAGPKQKTLQYPTKQDWKKLNILFEGKLPKYEDYVFKFNLQYGLTDVWDDINFYFKKNTKFHSTQKPDQLIQRIIETSSNKNDLILDPFMGSGSSLLNAKNMERNFIGNDIDVDYYNIVKERLKDQNYAISKEDLDLIKNRGKEKGKKQKRELIKKEN